MRDKDVQNTWESKLNVINYSAALAKETAKAAEELFKMKKKGLLVLLFLFVLNILIWKEVYKVNSLDFFEVVFFDVGQGDSTFIKTSLGHRILIDGGPDPELLIEKISKKLPLYDKRIDLIILTHPHSDHIRGLIAVLENYEVGGVIWTGVIESAHDFKKWEKAIEKKDTVFIAKAGTRVRAGETILDILYPFESLEGESFKDCNNTSIVIKVNYKDISFLFTGDAYKNVERELVLFEKECIEEKRIGPLCEIMVLDSEVLQAGHHGSKTSSSEEFIRAVSPLFTVISAGRENRYGHPHEETLFTLKKFNTNILGTYNIGDIRMISDGKRLKIIK